MVYGKAPFFLLLSFFFALFYFPCLPPFFYFLITFSFNCNFISCSASTWHLPQMICSAPKRIMKYLLKKDINLIYNSTSRTTNFGYNGKQCNFKLTFETKIIRNLCTWSREAFSSASLGELHTGRSVGRSVTLSALPFSRRLMEGSVANAIVSLDTPQSD